MHKALGSNPSAQEMKAGGSEVEGHHRLYSDFRVGYMKLSQKQKDHGGWTHLVKTGVSTYWVASFCSAVSFLLF